MNSIAELLRTNIFESSDAVDTGLMGVTLAPQRPTARQTGGADGTKLFNNAIADDADGATVDNGILVPMMVDDADGATVDNGISVDDVEGASVDEGSVGNADGALGAGASALTVVPVGAGTFDVHHSVHALLGSLCAVGGNGARA